MIRPGGPGVVETIRDEVTRLGALDSVNGQMALVLAWHLERPDQAEADYEAVGEVLARVMTLIREAAAHAAADEVARRRARRWLW